MASICTIWFWISLLYDIVLRNLNHRHILFINFEGLICILLLINYKSIKMKKFLLLLLLNISMLSAQENEIFLMRFHEMEVSGNQSEFISANKNYFKPLASQAIKDNKWAGWQMLQSVTESNKFVFIHYYNSPKQYETQNNVFSSEVAEKLGLESPKWDSFEWKTTAPMDIYQVFSVAGGNSQSNYWIKNDYKFNNRQKFIDNHKLFAEIVVKQLQKDTEGYNHGAAINLTTSNFENGEAVSYNGVSFDGFASLEELLTNGAYKENPETNKTWQKIGKKFTDEVEKKGASDFHTARKSTIWKLVDETWN